jgi:hypothetical protein
MRFRLVQGPQEHRGHTGRFFRACYQIRGQGTYVNLYTVKRAVFSIWIMLTLRKETEHNEIDLPADKRPIVKLLIQYLYEAEYDPILPTFTASTNTGNSSSPQTAPHTCSNNSNHYHCNSYSQHRWVCPHHYCGSQCKYTCTDFVCDQCITVKGDANQLLIHAQMYEMADKYDVIGLKTLSKEKFRLACIKFWDHPGFTRAAYHAYTTTPDNDTGLRSIIRETLSDHMVLLRKPMVKNLMTKFNGLSFDLLMAKAEQAGWCNK